jgi:hypothetical protein
MYPGPDFVGLIKNGKGILAPFRVQAQLLFAQL